MRDALARVESHVGVTDRSGGTKAVTARLREAGVKLADVTVPSWVIRDSIPRIHWRKFEELGLATQDELERLWAAKRAWRAETRRQAKGVPS